MKFELILIRYGEIALKGKETRRRFENILLTNIKNAFESRNLSFKIRKEWGRIYVYTDQIKQCINVLKKIFGITSISHSLKTISDLDSLSLLAADISKNELTQKNSFAVRASRTGQHEFTSQDAAIKIGDTVVKATKASVDLTNPDLELFVEIRNNNSYFFTEKIRCVGGMPLGSQGTVLALVDKPESVLAVWYIMRRGCKIVFLSSKKSNEKILKSFIKKWFGKSEIFTISSENDLNDEINKIVDEKKCNAIVTGHSLFYNDKKALFEIKRLKEQVNLPILHPLIIMSEDEIIKKSKEIGLSQ